MSLNLNNFWGDDISYSKSSNLSTATISQATSFIDDRQHRQLNQQQQQKQHIQQQQQHIQQQQHVQQQHIQQPQQQEPHQRTTQQMEENYDRTIMRDSELDARITEIVEKIWPCADDNVTKID